MRLQGTNYLMIFPLKNKGYLFQKQKKVHVYKYVQCIQYVEIRIIYYCPCCAFFKIKRTLKYFLIKHKLLVGGVNEMWKRQIFQIGNLFFLPFCIDHDGKC